MGFFDSLFLKCKILFWFFLHSFGTFQVRFTLQTKKNFSNKKYDAYVNCVVHRLISGQTHLWKELMLFIANLFTTKCASDELKICIWGREFYLPLILVNIWTSFRVYLVSQNNNKNVFLKDILFFHLDTFSQNKSIEACQNLKKYIFSHELLFNCFLKDFRGEFVQRLLATLQP